MAKKVAVLAVNPVNGFGLFQYLEAFFENGISYKVYAVAETREIKTNSGIELVADDVIANLIGHEDDFDALVFACEMILMLWFLPVGMRFLYSLKMRISLIMWT